ncbi:MAG: VacB/RNase II family 3'-5' exoribonuclease [Bdellovibrionales bacterium]|nr:VacB/RNase II family 3'-5' exoribonuclease [Bdellovibrionales bacterium]
MSKKSSYLLRGILKRHPDGFGFVIPEDSKHPDIYIPLTQIGSALNNDQVDVLVYEKKKKSTRAFTGYIQAIVKRDREHVVGFFEFQKNRAFLVRHNLGFSQALPLICPKKIPVKAGDFIKARILFHEKPFMQLGKRLKKSQKHVKGFEKNLKILRSASLNQKSSESQKTLDFPFKIELIKNLGSLSFSAKDDIKRIMAEYDLPFEFPSEVLNSLKALPKTVRKKDYDDRKDLRSKPFVTIDGATAQDFDDAIYVEKHPNFYKLYVAIADVSYYVQENSPLDQCAFERGNSYYFPNFCIPMLPEKLSHDLCSLKEKEDRLVMVQEIDFNFQGQIIQKDIYPSVIKSQKRLTYGQVQDLLDKECFSEPYRNSLKQSKALAQILIQKHKRKLGFDLEIPETLVLVNEEGEPEDILKEARLFSHKMIEQFMLACNQVVSAFLEKHNISFTYRIHEAPEKDKLATLEKFARSLSFLKSFKSRKNILHFLNQYKNHSKISLIHKLFLRSMSQARYSSFNKGHYGLNFKSYTHFTSPIRRYNDLLIHRLVKKVLNQKSGQFKGNLLQKELEKKAVYLSAREQKSVKAERKIKDIKSARFLKSYVGDCLSGSISSLTPFGIFITLKDFFVEGLIRYQDMKGFWETDETCLFAKNRKTGFKIQMGDSVDVLIKASHIQKGQIDLKLLNHKGKEFFY